MSSPHAAAPCLQPGSKTLFLIRHAESINNVRPSIPALLCCSQATDWQRLIVLSQHQSLALLYPKSDARAGRQEGGSAIVATVVHAAFDGRLVSRRFAPLLFNSSPTAAHLFSRVPLTTVDTPPAQAASPPSLWTPICRCRAKLWSND